MLTRGLTAAVRSFLDDFTSRPGRLVLAAMWTTDLGFFIVRAVQILGPPTEDTRFVLEYDGSYPEFFQYLKFFWLSCIFAHLSVKADRRYLLWTALFGYLLLDDSLSIHETAGERLGLYLSWAPSGLGGPAAVGELILFASIGLFTVAAVAILAPRHPPAFRQLSADLVVLLAFVAVFGVGIDAIHSVAEGMFGSGKHIAVIFGAIEDGGEMLAVSLIVGYGAQTAFSGLPTDDGPFLITYLRRTSVHSF